MYCDLRYVGYGRWIHWLWILAILQSPRLLRNFLCRHQGDSGLV